jgi:hypothetical protein
MSDKPVPCLSCPRLAEAAEPIGAVDHDSLVPVHLDDLVLTAHTFTS